MSLLLRSGLGWSLKRSPRNSASERPRFWSMTPIDPSKITIRCLNSRSRRSWTVVATAMVTPKSTESGPLGPLSGPGRAPDLESAVVEQHVPSTTRQLVDGGEALRRVGGPADVGIVVEDHVTAGVELVGKVVDRVAVGEPDGQADVGADRRVRRDHLRRGPQLVQGVRARIKRGIGIQGGREAARPPSDEESRHDECQSIGRL